MEVQRFTASDGTPLVYWDVGARDGVPLVLCHGLGAGAEQFTLDARFFAQHGFRVIAPDLRGHGASGVPQTGADAGYGLERLAQDQIDMLDHAGIDRAHWVGNSLGGIIGLTLVASHSGRFASLSLFGTALALSLPRWTAAFMPAIDRFPGRGPMARMTAWSTTRNRAARPLVEALLNRYDGAAVTAMIGHITRYDLLAAARAWAGPGLVMVGGRDRAVNRALLGQLETLRRRPNWRIVDLPEGGHCANLDATDLWRATLLAFWHDCP
ncbi:alpha/beta fold hydrolase [Devosia chinhatensis]|uniref:alpha/beta fold hydrolase n=1 Tax=Devosia chinhatensis TaxID=429727 RepID=UPI000695AA3A|nr:alpha/beta fold hydrolase [Devosia chinhatensis]